eukprot:NODE_12_length_45166_cov_0.552511.p8 type:complete len:431 gc:universal NODE_12_length_45166_cov_0.552511:10573-9281(-)
MALFPYYKSTSANNYLAITGALIKDVKLTRKAWVFPGQKVLDFSIQPQNYHLKIEAMSIEKLPFHLPATFTIGPNLDLNDLHSYAMLLTEENNGLEHLKTIILGIVEGETRVLAAALTMEAIFEGTKKFKSDIFDKIQLELKHFGLFVYNANIKQLEDTPGHEYFSYLGKKIQVEAQNQAKIDIAEANARGTIQSNIKDNHTQQELAKQNNQTEQFNIDQSTMTKKVLKDKEIEVVRNANVKNADMEIERTKLQLTMELAQIEKDKKTQIRNMELQRELYEKTALTEIESYKSKLLSKNVVDNEIKIKTVDTYLYEKQKESEAAILLAKAQAESIEIVLKALNNNVEYYLYYEMLNKGTLTKLAEINSSAIKSLNPTISVWNNGNGNTMQPIVDIATTTVPLMQALSKQTGIEILPQLFKNQNAQRVNEK